MKKRVKVQLPDEFIIQFIPEAIGFNYMPRKKKKQMKKFVELTLNNMLADENSELCKKINAIKDKLN